MPRINPEILVWARKTAGLTPEEAVRHLGINDAYGILAINRLENLENGTTEPSRPLLLKMVKTYRRSLLTFYLSAPPRKENRGQDFRTLPHNYSMSDEGMVDALVRDILARQSIVRSLLEDDDDIKPIEFIGSAKITDGVSSLVISIKNTLGINNEDFSAQPNPEKAFTLLRSKAEAIGIIVLLIGDLGSYHTTLKLTDFRGFALADKLAPFIVINDHDNHAAWSFTLLHELSHIWLGQSGISGARAEKELEKFCNDVAGEFLLPEEDIKQLHINKNTDLDEAQEMITSFAIDRNLSNSMVAYKLYRFDIIEKATWEILSGIFRAKWLDARNQKDKKETNKGPSYYIIRQHRIGLPLIKFADRMISSGSITTTKAGKLLGVHAKNVQHLIENIRLK